MRRFPVFARNLTLCLAVLTVTGVALSAEEVPAPNPPKIKEASNEGEKAIPRIRVPEGFKVELFAAEPLLANPVAFSIDEQGRFFVAETFRQKNAVLDNRDHGDWLDDELAATTVEDRLVYYKKYLKEKLAGFVKEDDRIRLVEDRDRDGKADTATVFADRFNSVLEGTGAGVLARNGKVWYANIPNFWLLEDTKGTGKADVRKALSYGYGVHVAFRGHDSHGIVFGPDGKLYFSIGDRGLFIKTPDGRVLDNPHTGAVLRCEPDGSELEIFATGVRNPQELAFDEFGNLFTGDNNSDSGDRARWVYLLEGGDSGWLFSFQYLSDRGPWNREKLWHAPWAGQAASIVPPITNLADGPSGLAYYPGTGFPDKYQGHFFLCDFRGAAGGSGVRSFALKPKGAGFEVIDSAEFCWSLLVTDVGFGPDSAMYVSDWVEGWDGDGRGRLYRISNPAAADNAVVKQTREIIAAGMSTRKTDDVVKLLSHPNQQVRQTAQFALAERKATAALLPVALKNENRLARVHAVWGLGQIGRKQPAALEPLLPLLDDADPEVQCQVARVIGDARLTKASTALIGLLKSKEARVRMFAAMTLGKLGVKEARESLVVMLRENNDEDPFLRHGGIVGLAGTGTEASLLEAGKDSSPAVRLAAVVALRRKKSPAVAQFLKDADARVIEEAARAINDAPLADAMVPLAAISARTGLTEPTLWRVINANFRLGGPENAAAVASLASRTDVPEALRIEAINALGDWTTPSSRDRVLGLWRPLSPRDANIAANALRPALGGIFSGSPKLRQAAASVAAKLGIKEIGPALFEIIANATQPASARAEALLALQSLNDPQIPQATEIALAADVPLLRAAGRNVLAKRHPETALEKLEETLLNGEVVERQMALATLAEMKSPPADAILTRAMDELVKGELPASLALDVQEAARKRPIDALKKLLATYEAERPQETKVDKFSETLEGGDADRGRRIFFEKAEVSCVRCHKIGGIGGEVGPDLTKVGEQKRPYLLEALVDPNKQIAKGFDSVILVLDSGKIVTGIVKGDDGKQLKLLTPEGQTLVISHAEIEDQTRGKSAMPEDITYKLTKGEIRDLVEFLSRQK